MKGFSEKDSKAKPSDAWAWYFLPSHMLYQGEENVMSVSGVSWQVRAAGPCRSEFAQKR